jgi:putative hydrolase of the HAD superfamily
LVLNDLDKNFKIVCLAEDIGAKKPNHEIFQKAILDSNSNINCCIMVGDRLDIDILPANELGMKTIRTLDSLYKIQEPVNKKETPLFTIHSLSELPEILSHIS